MKSRIINAILVFILSILITGCSTNSTNIIPTNSSSTSSDTQVLSDNNKIYEEYKAVLENKTEFFSTDNKKSLYLNDFLTNKDIYGVAFKVTHFTVLDMDGDKVPEIVLELTVDTSPEFYEVLHYMDGKVYGYNVVYRGLEELKADGTFTYSSGAADTGCGKLIFTSNAYKIDTLAESKSSQDGADLTISYFINNKTVTKEAFDSFMKEQHAKKDVIWYEFSQNNIDTELSINP